MNQTRHPLSTNARILATLASAPKEVWTGPLLSQAMTARAGGVGLSVLYPALGRLRAAGLIVAARDQGFRISAKGLAELRALAKAIGRFYVTAN